ncbi:GGDEF domain-containing protein [Gammaproteobacteria bacterium]
MIWTACLVVLQGTGIGNKILLDKDEISVGRAKEMDLCLTQGGVSRMHAMIRRVDDQRFLIADNNSTNGTLVNSVRVKEHVLNDQDIIVIGSNTLKFISSDSQEQAYHEELYRQSHMDRALQVYNKQYFLNRLDEEIVRCRRYGGELSLILFDADHFKRLNDTYGHLAGDAALMHLVEIIKKRIRDSDILCRYGGEEFTVIMPHTGQQQAFVLAEHIRMRVAKTPLDHSGETIDITISIGISSYFFDGTRPCTRELLISQADQALYQSKNSGRNKATIFDFTL